MNVRHYTFRYAQRGVSAVEFGLVAAILFALLFGIIEFGRLFFTINSVQEITRRAAREQVVNWVTATGNIRCHALLQPSGCGEGAHFPGAIDIEKAHVQLSFYNTYEDAVAGEDPITPSSSDPGSNLTNCLEGNEACIRFVRATLTDAGGPVDFEVIAPYMPRDVFSLPRSTVIMPAEALGLRY